MKIGIDIDGVLTDFEKFVLIYGRKHFKKVCNLEISNRNGYDVDEVFNLEKYFSVTGMAKDKIEKSIKNAVNEFWFIYSFKYCLLEPARKGARETTKKLIDTGDQIYIISSRMMTGNNSLIGKIIRKLTCIWLKRNGIKYHKIIFLKNDKDKLDSIKSNNIDIMIDDKIDILCSINEFTHVVSINANYNQNCNLSGIYKADGFENEEVYNIICDIKNSMKLVRLQKT